MRKVKGFKLEVRPKELQRLARKAGLDLGFAGGPEGLPREVAALSRLIAPAVLYDTFPAGTSGTPIPGVAFSVVLATLGPALPSRRRELEAAEPARARLWALAAGSALGSAVRFAASLIESEAALENCELSPISTVTGQDALAAALDRLDCAKVGVSLGDAGLEPADSAVVTLSWLSKSRGRKAKA